MQEVSPERPKRLPNKVAIITGAANGMGESTARLFASEGASVVLTDVMADRGEIIAREIRDTGAQAISLRADVTSDGDWKDVFDRTVSEFGTVDILVNNAGISSSAVGDLDEIDGWNRLISVNATSVFLGTQRAVDIMARAGTGAIVNISSIMGIAGGVTGHPGYHASKAAVRNYSKAMACRCGPQGIRINTIHPGYMQPMTNSTNSHIREDRAKLTPLRRTGRPSEVAYGALFLASDEASFITGTELVIDGGFLAQ